MVQICFYSEYHHDTDVLFWKARILFNEASAGSSVKFRNGTIVVLKRQNSIKTEQSARAKCGTKAAAAAP